MNITLNGQRRVLYTVIYIYTKYFHSSITLGQGTPGSKFVRAPRPSAKGTTTERQMCKISKGYGGMPPGKIWNLESLKWHFLHFGGRFYGHFILMVRKRHTAWAWPPLEVMAPGPTQSEPIVVTPLTLQHSSNLTKENWNSLFTPTVDACLTFNLYFRWWLYDSSSWLADSRITLNYNNYIMLVFWYLHVICSVSPPGVCLSALRFIFPKMKQLHGINFQICRLVAFDDTCD